MKNEVVKFDAPELQGMEESKAAQIKATFEPMVEMLTEFEDAYNGVVLESKNAITTDVIKKAKRIRLDIKSIRTNTEKIRKEQKEEYLRAGKAIDGVANILKFAVTDKENKLKEIETYFEVQEQNRLEELQAERVEKLSVYIEDANERDLSKFENDEFEALLSMKKKQYEDKIAAEKQAELDRIEKEKKESEERKRIAAENERLKKEAIDRERLAKIESDKREKAEKERKAKEEEERKKREAKEIKERAEYEAKLKAEREAKEKIEREAKAKSDKLEAELKAKEDAERKAKEEKEAELQDELNKGDAAKVQDLISDLEALKSKYSFKSNANTKKYNAVGLLIDKVITYIKK